MFDYSRKPVKWQVGNFSLLIRLPSWKATISSGISCVRSVPIIRVPTATDMLRARKRGIKKDGIKDDMKDEKKDERKEP